MNENVGKPDQVVRAVVGPLLLIIGYTLLGGRRGKPAGLAAMLAGAMTVQTAVTRTCPLNEYLGINTNHHPPR